MCIRDSAVAACMLTFEEQLTVDHVLEHLRPGDRALFVDVTDDKDRHAAALCQLHERHGAVLDLRNAAGGRGIFRGIERLDGVSNENVRLDVIHRAQDLGQIGFREDVQLVRRDLQTVGAQLDLLFRFLAGDIEDPQRFSQVRADLQQQRRFADRCV